MSLARMLLYAALILMTVLLAAAMFLSTSALGATACAASPSGRGWSWRQIDGRRCWYPSRRLIPKSALYWPRAAPRAKPAALLPPPELVAEPPEIEDEPLPPKPVEFTVRFEAVPDTAPEAFVQTSPAPPPAPAIPYPLLLAPLLLSLWAFSKAAPRFIHHRRKLAMVDHHRHPPQNYDDAPIQPRIPRMPEPPPPPPSAIPDVPRAAAEATRAAAKRLIDESRAAIQAARGILEMLEKEQELYAAELTRFAEAQAVRIADYLATCQSARDAMAMHRENMMQVARQISEHAAPTEQR